MFRIVASRTARPAMTRLAQTPAAARRFASSDSRPASQPDEKEPEFEEEGFNSPMWKYSLGAIGLMFLMGKYDDYVEQSGRVHPLTKFYASIMSDKEANRRVFTAYQQEVAKVAEFNIFQWEEYNSDVVRALDNAVYYKRSANWGTPVGSQVDMSGAHGRTPVRE